PALGSAPATNDQTPVLSGTAAPGSTVMIALDLNGDNQPDVTYITTADGNVSSTVSQVLTVDTGVPSTPAIGSADTTNDPTPAMGGVAEPGSTVTIGI